MDILRIARIAMIPVALSGCSVVDAMRVRPDTFELGVPGVAKASPVRRGTQILIAEPQALKTLDSQNIVVQTDALTIRYLDKAQWSDRLPRLVQVRLAQAFQNTGRFKGVGLPGQGLAIDYQIVTEIRSLGVDATGNAAVVSIAVKILNDRNGVVASEEVFTSRAAASGAGNEAYVAAIDAAFESVTRDIVAWVTARI